MGKQIQTALTVNDERDFMSFLRSISDIQLFELFAPTKEALLVDNFNEETENHWSYYIWNKSYSWMPEYKQLDDKTENKRHIGWWYIANTNNAPLLELRRTDVKRKKAGRLYWSKDFAAPDGVLYDMNSFDKWYQKIIRWIRKNSQLINDDGIRIYYFADAFKRMRT